MKHTLERESAGPEPPASQPIARVVLMTADGGSIDITHTTGNLLYLVRRTVHSVERAGADTGCPPSLAVLCKHLGRCEAQCRNGHAPPVGPPSSTVEAVGRLTGRESQVVEHVRLGFTNKEIARELGIQEDTVKKHLKAVFSKLGVHRRALLALRRVSAA